MASVTERMAKGGVGFFAANILKQGLGFLFIVVASRVLGPAEFGVLALCLSIIGLVRKFATFGLPSTIQRFLSGKGEERSEQLYGAILISGGVGAIIASISLFLAAPWATTFFDEPALTEPLRVLAIGVIASTGFSLLQGVLKSREQIRYVLAVDTVKGATKIGFGVVLFLLYVKSAVSAAWAIVGSFFAAFILAIICVRRLNLRATLEIEWEDIRSVLGYSAPLVIAGFGYFLTRQADRLMLGWLAEASSVGLYTVASTLAMVMGIFDNALVSIFMPVASDAYRKNATRKMRRSYLFVSKWSGAVSGLALLAFTGLGPFFLKLFGTEYAVGSTYHVLVVLAVMYFVWTWSGPTGALLQMSDGNYVEMVNTSLFFVLNLVLNYVLIKKFGIYGAAYATLISSVFLNSIQVLENIIYNDVSPFGAKNILIMSIVATGTFILILTDNNIARTVVTLVSGSVLVFYVYWSLEKSEKKYMSSLLERAFGEKVA